MTIARELLAAVVTELRGDQTLARELREALGIATATSAPETLYLRVAAYAERVSMSERTIWHLITRGLPTVGCGRARRVDVARADDWLRAQATAVDDAVERSARASARRAARRAGT